MVYFKRNRRKGFFEIIENIFRSQGRFTQQMIDM